jgi:hypothetical protein
MGLVLVTEIERRHRMIYENSRLPPHVGDVYRTEFGDPDDTGRLVTVVDISRFSGGFMRQVTLLEDDGGMTHMLEHTFYGIFSRVTGGDHGVDSEHAQRPIEEHADHVEGEQADGG